jgi:hypothetical protein
MGHFLSKLRFAACVSISAALVAGCDRPSSDSAKQTTNTETKSVAAAVPQPGKDEKFCFNCTGQGTVACRAPGCVAGKVDCPGSCIKLNRGNWVQMAVAGHDPHEWWIKFPNASGLGGYQAWTRAHVGEAIVYQNGQAVNIGPCKICGGTTRVPCPVCKGAGKMTCEVCQGKKFVPQSWTATDNPWLNSQPDLIRLTDGRVVLGKIVLSSGNDRTIKTREGKILHVTASEIAPNAESRTASGTKL